MNFPEKRKSVRYDGEIPLELKQGAGLTRNYSTDGIYFVTDQPLSVGEQIEFVMPLDHAGLGRAVRLRCQGDVLRVEPGPENTGVAVAITSHLFEGVPGLAESYLDNAVR